MWWAKRRIGELDWGRAQKKALKKAVRLGKQMYEGGIQGKGNCQSKGPEAGLSLVGLWKSKGLQSWRGARRITRGDSGRKSGVRSDPTDLTGT